jgi:AraC-like DNA-binding protein
MAILVPIEYIFAAMLFTNPLAFEEFLSPVADGVKIRPMVGSHFRGNIEMHTLQRVGLFTLETDSFVVRKPPGQDFYGFSVPLASPFTVSAPGYDQTFSRSNAHMLSPGQPFTFQCKKKCDVLVANFFVDSMTTYKERMLQETTSRGEIIGPQVSLMSKAGSGLYRSVVRAWVALGIKEYSLNDIATQELEDDLLSCFLSLAENPPVTTKLAVLPSNKNLNHVEDYICANLDAAITRDELADLTGASIRSLSRAFEEKYGLGPMAFVRQRRLDACYAQLLGSDRDATSVTEVAMSYGFWHLGKFAIAYKETFGESPSETLLK